MKRLKPYHSNERDGIATIKRNFIRHPLFQNRVKVSADDVVGSSALAWHRGHQSGVFDAHRTLAKAHPKAAEALLLAYRMTKDGSYIL